MMTKEKLSPTEAPVALSVVMASTITPVQAAGAFSGLDRKGTDMANQWDTSPYPVDGAASEAKDCAPVARGTVPERDKWFWVAASMAQDAGHISSEGLKRVQVALYGEAVAL